MMAAATSCDKYDIYPTEYNDVLMIKDGGDKELTAYSTDDHTDLPIIVLKGGHTPETAATCTLRIMTDGDFDSYLDDNYGEGHSALTKINPDLYTLIDKNGNEVNSITEAFKGSDDRYLNATLRLKSSKFADWFYALTDEEKNATNYVIPIGLYSEDAPINQYGSYLIVTPSATDPKMTCDMANLSFKLDELGRTNILKGEYGWEYRPEVYLSIPCENPWGFSVRLGDVAKTTDLDAVQTAAGNGILFQGLSAKPKYGVEGSEEFYFENGYLYGTPNDKGKIGAPYFVPNDENGLVANTTIPHVDFPAGVTKARIPLVIKLKGIVQQRDEDGKLIKPTKDEAGNYNNLDVAFGEGWVIDPDNDLNVNKGVGLSIPESTDKNPCIIWNGEQAPDSASMARLGLTPSQFFVGVNVVEVPLDLSEDNVTSNDCEPSEGSIGALFDDNLATFFHSGWTVAFEREKKFCSYLEIHLEEEINSCFFKIVARSVNPASPKKIHLYYATHLYEDENGNTDQSDWTYFAEGKNAAKLKAGESMEIGKINKMLQTEDGTKFKYMRFCVMENDKGESLGSPNTKVYWNLAELRMYGKVQ